MNWDRNTKFLFRLASERFLEILKEFAESIGVDGRFVERVVDGYFTNPGSFSDILAEYPDRQAELRLACLLRASKAVHDEIVRHFESKRKGSRKALSYEIPSDKYMGLRLEAEYMLRYVRGVNEELSKLKEAALMGDRLLEAIKQVEQLNIDWEAINKQIKEMVQAEVASQFIGVSQLRQDMESQQDELKKVDVQVKATNKDMASVEELQAIKVRLQQDQQHSSETFEELGERLKWLEDRLEEAKQERKRNDQNQSDGAKENCEEFKKHLERCRDSLPFFNDLGMLDGRVVRLESYINLDGSESRLADELERRAKAEQQKLKAVFKRLKAMFNRKVEKAVEKFLSAKSERLTYLVLMEIDQAEEYIARNLTRTVNDLTETLRAEGATDENVKIVELRHPHASSRQRLIEEIIRIVELRHPNSSSRQRFKDR